MDEASYAAVPHLVRIHRERGILDWNTYAIINCIELARTRGRNPPIPDWLLPGYQQALADLARCGLTEFEQASRDEEVQSILVVLALWKGSRAHGRVLAEFGNDEVAEIVGELYV